MNAGRTLLAGCLAGAIATLAAATPVHAQGWRRVAVDTVIGVQDLFGETRDWPTALVFDPFVSAEIRPNLQVAARPKVWRLDGEWDLVLDQASIHYAFRAGSNWRIEAGRFPSPIGLGMTENRPNVNASTIWWHRPYYMPLPRLGAGAPMVSLVSAIYPDGVTVATSAAHWDARVAVVDTAPVQFWRATDGVDPSAHVIVGAGITPRQGLRIGAAAAWGDMTEGPAGAYRMLNLEADFSVGYTRLSGEVTHDDFTMPGGDHEAWGWTLQAQRTLTPRLFAHARATTMHAPVLAAGGAASTQAWRSLDTTIGFRLDPEVTLKAGYTALATWGSSDVDHQASVALMWSRRWW